MTLAEVSLPVSYQWGSGHALIFDAALAQRLAAVQAEHGDARHVPHAVALTDGRYMLSADILTECVPGGLVYGGFSHLDASRFDEIEVVPASDAMMLLPSEPTLP